MKLRLSFLFCVAFVYAAWAQPSAREHGEYALVLENPPAAAVAAKASRAAVQSAQQEVYRLLAERNIHVTGSVSTAINAIYVRAGAGQESMLRGLPGVKNVVWVPAVKLHLNKAIELANVPAAWNLVNGQDNAGVGVKIGIIDTGIDQTHPAFQDTALQRPSSVPTCVDTVGLATLRTNICSYTTNKVIVARTYVYENARGENSGREFAQLSRPDDLSPRDRIGHGTATAMIAAGRQVSTPAGVSISGVAPKAWLGNYKVFGSPGVSGEFVYWSSVSMALEDAFNDGMDIVSLSLGSPAFYTWNDQPPACSGNPGDQCDFRAWDVNQYPGLSPRGMTVVVSAGNDGDLGVQPMAQSSIATPGTAPAAITVGATTNSQDWFQTVGLTAGDAPQNLRNIPAVFGGGPRPGSRTDPAPLRDVAAVGPNGFACSSLPAGSLNGAVALVQRGGPAGAAACNFLVKVRNAAAAGARGVIIYMLDGQNDPFPPGGLGGTNIPAAMIGNTDGTALKSFVASHNDTPVVFDPTWRSRSDDANFVTAWSARGPALGTLDIKPEVVAPGIVYTATQNYDPNAGDLFDASRYSAVSGTSFSAPLVAGIAALVKGKNSTFAPADIKSAIVNTARLQPVRETDGTPAGVTGAGAGLVDAEAALKTNVTLVPPTLSFGAVGTGSTTLNRTITVTNRSGNQLTAQLETADSNIAISSPQSGTMNVTLTRPTNPRRYEGTILIKGGAVDLRVPYVYYVGDGIPYNIYAIQGDDGDGVVNERISGLLAARVVDRYGVPVDTPDNTVAFRSIQGGGSVDFNPAQGCGADSGTDKYGIAAAACVRLGGTIGEQQWQMQVQHAGANLTQDFFISARQWPSIQSNGVIDAASLQSGRRLVPGSYAAIKGSDLSDITKVFNELTLPTPPYLPLSIGRVSVSFDVPGLSVPAAIHFVSPEQINIQIPWEMEGQTTAWMKVSIGDFSTLIYDVPLTAASPGVFEWPGEYAAAQHLDYRNITTTNPARKNEDIIIYVNGLGQVENRPATGQQTPMPGGSVGLSRAVITPTVTIGGRSAQVSFAGLSPTAIALGQINVKVPADAPSGRQPVVISSNGTDSKTVYLPIE